MKKELMPSANVLLPVLGILGLPESLMTNFKLVMSASGLVRVQVEYLVDKEQFKALDGYLRPIFAEYELVKCDPRPNDPAPEPIKVDPPVKHTLEEMLQMATSMKANVEKAIAERDSKKEAG
jgi:hypothetical protein